MGKKNKPTDVFKCIDMSGGPDACWPWIKGLSSSGRPYFDLNGKKVLSYRLTYELFNGFPIPEGQDGRHTCDNEICCNPKHLIPGTRQDNMDDMKERERHGLPHNTVRAIKNLLVKNEATGKPTHEAIADIFGVSRETITAIKAGRVYAHVKLKTE